MRSALRMLACIVACAPTVGVHADQGDGLRARIDSAEWPRWQGRLAMGTASPLFPQDSIGRGASGLKVQAVGLLGDYYFSSSPARQATVGGFRATSGLLIGSRPSSLLSASASGAAQGLAFSADRRSLGVLQPEVGAPDTAGDAGATPYVGFGYSGLSVKGGWGFSADIGVAALSPRSTVKLGRVVSGNQSYDEVMQKMRLSPLVQLGVSYSF